MFICAFGGDDPSGNDCSWKVSMLSLSGKETEGVLVMSDEHKKLNQTSKRLTQENLQCVKVCPADVLRIFRHGLFCRPC